MTSPNNKLLFTIADRFEPKIATALLEAFAVIKDKVGLDELEDIIRTNGITGAYNYLSRLEVTKVINSKIVTQLEDAVNESGRVALVAIPAKAILTDTFVFSSLDPSVANYIRNYELSLVQQVSNESIAAIQQAIEADYIAGNGPRSTARVFRDTIGLTKRQELAVRNYETALRELDKNALLRKLRDKRFDATVLRAIEENKTLSEAQIQKLVGRYRERYIKFRSETIARTESLRAVTAGQHQSLLQAMNNGDIDGDLIRREWVYAKDERTRAAHRQIPSMNLDGVRIDEAFKTPLGDLLYPRDPAGSAANTINCRCRVVYKMIEEEEV